MNTPTPFKNYRLLVVDDSDFARAQISSLLTQLGFTVAGEAGNAEDALKQIREKKPHLVLTDIVMPNISGIELAEKISQNFSQIGVMMISSLHHEQVVLESIAAGAIPVIMADTWAPPGNIRLWEMAAVFCKEDPEEIKKLPDRLAKIAENQEQIALMRYAMRQLWLLYGPDSFVTDVQEFMLSYDVRPADAPATNVNEVPNLANIVTALATGDGRFLLQQCASALLLDPVTTLQRIANDELLAAGLDKARKSQSIDSNELQHYDAILSLAKRKAKPLSQNTFAMPKKSVPKICLYGRHSNRTPLSYEPIRLMIGSQLILIWGKLMIIKILPTTENTFELLDIVIEEQAQYYGAKNQHVIDHMKANMKGLKRW